MPNTRYIDTVDAAKLLRALLKKNFPGAKFSVKSSRYAGGSSIHIDWENGPCENKVRALTDPYAGARFDGMIDMQSYVTAIMLADGTVTWGKAGDDGPSSREYNHPLPEGAEYVRMGCDYVQTSRDLTPEGIAGAMDWFNKNRIGSDEDPLWFQDTKWGKRIAFTNNSREAYDNFYRFLRDTDLPFVAPVPEKVTA